MTNRRIQAAAVAATAGGGLLTAAFLQAAVATAAPGEDAFTIDGTTFDPITAAGAEGFDPVPPLSTAAPLLILGGGVANLGFLQIDLAPQIFDLYNGTTSLGSIDTNETVSYLFGLPNTAFTVLDTAAADGVDAAKLPVAGTVYDVLNLGGGFYNVYVATPGKDGTVTDTLVTPFGNTDLSALFADMNAANPLQPGDAFAALQVGDSSLGDDAFTIGSTTFNPFSTAEDGTVTDGFNPVNSLGSAPPLLNLGGGILLGSSPLAPQDFDVYSGSGSSLSELGTIHTGVDATNLLGMANTQFTVLSSTPDDGTDASLLPANGTVYDVLNLGNGWANVYTATPDVGSTSGTVTDTLVTPFGNMNLDSLFGGINAANKLDPGDAFTGLSVSGDGLGEDAFSLGGFTFDPFSGSGDTETEGFTPVPGLIGAAPLLNIAVGTIQKNDTIPLHLATQHFDVYSGSGSNLTDLGTITASEDVTNLFGLTNTALTVFDTTPVDGVDASLLPENGTVYDVFNFGGGWQNVYIATPGEDGTITDTLVTPFGNIDLSSLFGGIDAANPLDAGAAFIGLDDAMSTAAGSFDLFDPSSWF
ncbi:hypothetical protein [Mycolicibacter sinensis]|uniref:DUF4394 domain-containing protein n=1 Tax=Mycolicibacter sinensis (strain JDM601) TaxID=875328 RepID=A0A1A3U555_MYCSD|nr:hypothetical protein [Mycolicibacter sinensis]OBK89986.1 hypothetical protein A5648_18180 [Mycolicibacter sinensis]